MTSETDEMGPAGQLHSAFRAWLAEAGPRLAVAINVQRSTPDVIEFGFDLANPVLMGSLTTAGDLVVSAEWQDECWDFLLSEEARPEPMATGTRCKRSLCASACLSNPRGCLPRSACPAPSLKTQIHCDKIRREVLSSISWRNSP